MRSQHALAVCTVLAVAAAEATTDLKRARVKVPGAHLQGDGHRDTSQRLNARLRAAPGLRTRSCETFTVRELMAVQREILARADPGLQAIYHETKDNRRLVAFGTVVEGAHALEAAWAQELALLDEHSGLQEVSRDAKCHEAVMWMVHHTPEGKIAELRERLTMPLLPERDRPRLASDLAGAAPEAAINDVMRGYNVAVGSNTCHNAAPVDEPQEHVANGAASATLHWPDTFVSTLLEARDSGNTTGRFTLDSTQASELVVRDVGRYDQICGTATGYPTSSKCANLATGGKRYAMWPEERKCCLCCADGNGCGAVTSHWLATADVSYLGQADFNGRRCDKWLRMGGQQNYYYQEVSTGLPVAVQMTNDVADFGQTLVFDPDTLDLGPVEPSVFTVPDYCAGDALCPGWCEILRRNHASDDGVGAQAAVV